MHGVLHGMKNFSNGMLTICLYSCVPFTYAGEPVRHAGVGRKYVVMEQVSYEGGYVLGQKLI